MNKIEKGKKSSWAQIGVRRKKGVCALFYKCTHLIFNEDF